MQITALQLPDHMETMIVDLTSIYSSSALLNVVYGGWKYALDLEFVAVTQIIHCTFGTDVVMCLYFFVLSKKKKLKTKQD